MSDGEIGNGPDPGAFRQPLPPEVPAPRKEPERPESVEPPDDAPELGTEWWRSPPPEEPPGPSTPSSGPDGPPDAGGPAAGDQGSQEPEFWRWNQVRDEWRDTWSAHGSEGIEAAHAIGAHIGEAISAHLPNPNAAAEKRGLDIRWLRLKYNVPALLLALLVTWGGQSSVDRMTASVTEDGIFAPLGWILMFALVLGLLMLMPIGSWLGAAFSNLINLLIHGAVRVFGGAWKMPVIGYLMRLALAVAIWSFIVAVARVTWRGIVHFLTGA
ncbi:hypothetical protein [Streptomyces sp. NPDC127197]|uniref:hypothetical protein n=1 Tax=Streptomyces sp. NPDC127197 TaxID=3345388 RepID=UPI0036443CDD